jgi:hypothetical protein
MTLDSNWSLTTRSLTNYFGFIINFISNYFAFIIDFISYPISKIPPR